MKSSNIAATIIVALVIAAVGVAVVNGAGMQEEWSENRENFQRYCTERFGEDAYVYSGGGQGVHGGLHCEDPVHKAVHLGAVDPMVWESYKNGDATAADVTNSLRDVGVMGNVGGWRWKQSLAVMGGLGTIVFAIGSVQRWRNSD